MSSLKAKMRRRYNISMSEIEGQELLQTGVFGIAAVCLYESAAENLAQELLDFIYEQTEAEISAAEHEIIKL